MPTEKKDLPATLRRSPEKAQRTYAETLDNAEETYDETSRAHRAAWSAVKHSFEKVGDHWEAKDEKGPSDSQAARKGRDARDGGGETSGGVDVQGNTWQQLYDRAKKADVRGRSRMNKQELARAIARRDG